MKSCTRFISRIIIGNCHCRFKEMSRLKGIRLLISKSLWRHWEVKDLNFPKAWNSYQRNNWTKMKIFYFLFLKHCTRKFKLLNLPPLCQKEQNKRKKFLSLVHLRARKAFNRMNSQFFRCFKGKNNQFLQDRWRNRRSQWWKWQRRSCFRIKGRRRASQISKVAIYWFRTRSKPLKEEEWRANYMNRKIR